MSKALVPVEQKVVTFYDDEVTAVRLEDGSIYVPVRPLCDYLGVVWSGQYERLQRDPVLSEVMTSVRVTRTQDQAREMICLPLDFVNGWLFGISANRVKDEVRERLIRYQRECYRVLAEAFQGTAVTVSASSALMQVREMGLAIVRMAEEQMAFDQRLGAVEGAVEIVGRLEERVTAVEEKLSPSAYVTQEQASQVSQAVKAVAMALGKKTGRNEFGAVYGELYRRFEITSYKSLPVLKFEDALAFLTEWHLNVTTDTPF